MRRLRRSKLFVPGSRPELFGKAFASAADAVSFDLEDAVAADRKAEARSIVARALAEFATSPKERVVRVNPLTSGWMSRTRYNGLALLISLALMPLGVIAAGLWSHAALVFLGLAGFGLARAVNIVLRYTLLQQQAPEELRGRMAGLLMVQSVTGTAIGSMAAGFVGQFFAPGSALVFYGVAVLVLTGVVALAAWPLHGKEQQ